MTHGTAQQYLEQFAQRAERAGLQLKRPGQNWVAAKDLVPGSHISLSVKQHQIQVNLNNERDEDRACFDKLYRDRAAIAEALGLSLAWEKKEGRKKTAIRATYPAGYDDSGWDAQHQWALETMIGFEREFGSRLPVHRE